MKTKQLYTFRVIDKKDNEHEFIATGYNMIEGIQHFYIDEFDYFIASFHQASAVINLGEYNEKN